MTAAEPPAAAAWPGALKRWGITLAIGTIGGALFFTLHMPLAWMLGAMLCVTAATLAGVPTGLPNPLRATFVAVLGIMLGSAFTPAIIGQFTAWAGGFLIATIYVIAATFLVYRFFSRHAGFDRVTAYFAATPGGVNEMSVVGQAMGGDIRRISLVHTVRVLSVVTLVPFFFRATSGASLPPLPQNAAHLADLALRDGALLAAAGLLGARLALRWNFPAAALTGPLIMSAAIHLAGVTAAKPPIEIIAMAQVVVGSAIGARFTGLSLQQVRRIALTGIMSSAGMVALAVAMGVGLAPLVGVHPVALVLALAPGGLAEMSLVALIMGEDTAFVSTMHIWRITLVIMAAPLVFRWLKLKEKAD